MCCTAVANNRLARLHLPPERVAGDGLTLDPLAGLELDVRDAQGRRIDFVEAPRLIDVALNGVVVAAFLRGLTGLAVGRRNDVTALALAGPFGPP